MNRVVLAAVLVGGVVVGGMLALPISDCGSVIAPADTDTAAALAATEDMTSAVLEGEPTLEAQHRAAAAADRCASAREERAVLAAATGACMALAAIVAGALPAAATPPPAPGPRRPAGALEPRSTRARRQTGRRVRRR